MWANPPRPFSSHCVRMNEEDPYSRVPPITRIAESTDAASAVHRPVSRPGYSGFSLSPRLYFDSGCGRQRRSGWRPGQTLSPAHRAWLLSRSHRGQIVAEHALSCVDAHGPGIHADHRHGLQPVSYTHLRAHETGRNLVCRLLLEKKKK